MPDGIGNFRIYATDRRGNSVVLTTRLITMVRLMVNGVAEYVKSGTTMTLRRCAPHHHLLHYPDHLPCGVCLCG